MRILVVDDLLPNAYLLEQLLTLSGFTVTVARNGAEALAELRTDSRIGLVVSDVLMPVMDGFQLCREVRRDPRLRHLPFLFYTATYTDPKDREFALSLGADGFLVKPAEPEAIVAKVREIVEAGASRAAAVAEAPETEQLVDYNARLIHKLEQKMEQLEAARNRLEASHRHLREEYEQRLMAEAERARLQERLAEAQKMEALALLARGVAHDFGNLLTIMLGHLSVLESQEGLGPRAQEDLRRIGAACRRASVLVRGVLMFGRGHTRKREAVKVCDLLTESAELLRSEPGMAATIGLSIEPDLPTLTADPAQVHQIIFNLGINAVQAMRGRCGTIVLGAARHTADGRATPTVGELPVGDYLRLTVADEGPGMSPETAQRCFEPFFSTRPTSGGTGLGLAVVRGAVLDHGGAIELQTSPAGGTTFEVYLPRAAR